jgi:hypothetical protein
MSADHEDRDWRRRNLFGFPLRDLMVLLLGGAAIGFAVTLFVSSERDRTAAATLLGAVFVAAGAFRTIQVTRDGQITERFADAIKELEADKPVLRLGGVYALERIAQDSERDHGPIMEVLTAYVRQHAPRVDDDPAVPRDEVQAVLAVIKRRNARHREHALDLRATRLCRARMPDADLSNAKLDKADLREADLPGTVLRGANLPGADLSGANLTGADLDGAVLANVDYDEETTWPDGSHNPPPRVTDYE